MYTLEESQLSIHGGQTIIHQYLHPFPTPPQSESEYPGVLVWAGETLVCRYYSVEETLAQIQDAKARHQPFVTCGREYYCLGGNGIVLRMNEVYVVRYLSTLN